MQGIRKKSTGSHSEPWRWCQVQAGYGKMKEQVHWNGVVVVFLCRGRCCKAAVWNSRSCSRLLLCLAEKALRLVQTIRKVVLVSCDRWLATSNRCELCLTMWRQWLQRWARYALKLFSFHVVQKGSFYKSVRFHTTITNTIIPGGAI